METNTQPTKEALKKAEEKFNSHKHLKKGNF